jgi:hypothetical protein
MIRPILAGFAFRSQFSQRSRPAHTLYRVQGRLRFEVEETTMSKKNLAPLTPMSSARACDELKGAPPTPPAPARDLRFEERLWKLLMRAYRQNDQLLVALHQVREKFAAYKVRGRLRGIAKELTGRKGQR